MVDTQGSHEVMKKELAELQNTDTRIILLYSTRDEAMSIFTVARELGLIGESYMWIVTQSVISFETAPDVFPIGTLGE